MSRATPVAVDRPERVSPAKGAAWVESAMWLVAVVLSWTLAYSAQLNRDVHVWYLPVVLGMAFMLRVGWRGLPVVAGVQAVMAWFGLGHRWEPTLAVTLGTVVESAFAYLCLERPSFRRAAETGPDLAPRVAFIGLIAGALGVTTTIMLERMAGVATHIGARAWFLWTLGDAGTLICFLPLALVLLGRTDGRAYASTRSRAEVAALFLLTFAVGWSHVLAETALVEYLLPGLMLGIIPVIWAATRLGLTATVWVVAVLTFATFTGMRWHPGDLIEPQDRIRHMFVVEGNLVVLSLIGMVSAQVLEAERRARAGLVRITEELKVQVEHVRLSQRSGRTGTWQSALDGAGMVWSDEMYVLLRLDRTSTTPSFAHLERAMSPTARETTAAALETIRRGERYSVHTLQFDWADGSRTWHAVRWEVVSTPEGPRIVATHTDITERLERRQAAEHMAALVGSVSEAILALDAEGRILRWNAAAERLFGWTPQDAVGRAWCELLPVPEQAAQRARITSVFRDGRTGAEILEMRSGRGRSLHVNTTLLPIRDAAGRITEVAVLCMDLTRQHELEHQLLQAQKMEIMGRLTGSIAHDFNNLLTAILGFSTLLRARVQNDAVAHGEVSQVMQAAERATALTQRLLSFTRSRPGRAERFAVDPALHHLEPLLRRLVGEGTDLVLDLRAQGAWVKLDTTQFEQVILNLVVNARDAMPFGGHLRIETLRMPEGLLRRVGPAMGTAGPGVCIHVVDTGEGIDEPTRERIFEPFFTTKDAGRGTGLGLSTVLAIVQECGGAVSVQSSPGEGTCFTVQLPEVEAGVAVHPVVAPARKPAGRGERILVVEDEPLVRDLILAALEPAGYRLEAVGSAELALERILADEIGYALVVSDVMLPRMTGIELVRQLRKRRPRVPALLLSGHGEAVRETKMSVPFLTKPFGNDELIEVVDRLVHSGLPAIGAGVPQDVGLRSD